MCLQIDEADQVLSAVSSEICDDGDLFFDVSPPYEPCVGS